MFFETVPRILHRSCEVVKWISSRKMEPTKWDRISAKAASIRLTVTSLGKAWLHIPVLFLIVKWIENIFVHCHITNINREKKYASGRGISSKRALCLENIYKKISCCPHSQPWHGSNKIFIYCRFLACPYPDGCAERHVAVPWPKHVSKSNARFTSDVPH